MTEATTASDAATASALSLMFAQVSFAPEVHELAAPQHVEELPRPVEAAVPAHVGTRSDRRSRLRTAHGEALARAAAEGATRAPDDTAEFVAGLRGQFASWETQAARPSRLSSVLRRFHLG